MGHSVENRLIFGKVKAYKNGASFFGPPCTAAFIAAAQRRICTGLHVSAKSLERLDCIRDLSRMTGGVIVTKGVIVAGDVYSIVYTVPAIP